MLVQVVKSRNNQLREVNTALLDILWKVPVQLWHTINICLNMKADREGYLTSVMIISLLM